MLPSFSDLKHGYTPKVLNLVQNNLWIYQTLMHLAETQVSFTKIKHYATVLEWL